jgi:glycerophosphoryl diester phosphodiesterase
MARPLLLGHRGLRGRRYGVRENTMAAFDVALEHGCDGFEFDVRLTADGCGVICHDAKYRGMRILTSAADRLRDLPRLEDVLARYAERAFLDIELKVLGLESCVTAALLRNPPRRGCVISSFVPKILSELSARDRSLPLGIICETQRQLSSWQDLPVEYVIAKESLVSRELLSETRSAGKKLFVWTVNSKKSILRLTEWRVDGIISDRTDLLVETVTRSGSSEL